MKLRAEGRKTPGLIRIQPVIPGCSSGCVLHMAIVLALLLGWSCMPDATFDNPCDPNTSPGTYEPCNEQCIKPQFSACHEETDGNAVYPVYNCVSDVFFCDWDDKCGWKKDWCDESLQLCCPDGWYCSHGGKCCDTKCFKAFECDYDPCGAFCGKCEENKGFECIHEVEDGTGKTLSTNCVRK